MINNTLNDICNNFSVEKGYIKHNNSEKLIKVTEAKKSIIQTIANVIYKYYYSLDIEYTTQFTDSIFINQLYNIQLGNQYLDSNWEITAIIDKNFIKVSKNNIYLIVNIEKETLLKQTPKINQLIDVLFSCHYPNISPGFYLYKSKKGSNGFDGKLSRIYINLKAKKVASFAEQLMNSLNEKNITFHFKILQTLPSSNRIDNSVLYFNQNDKDLVIKTLTDLYNKDYFNPVNSPFHLILFPGIGYAEEPLYKKDRNDSFGTHRSKIISESLYEQFSLEKRKKISPEKIIAKFLDYGIDTKKIYQEIEINE